MARGVQYQNSRHSWNKHSNLPYLKLKRKKKENRLTIYYILVSEICIENNTLVHIKLESCYSYIGWKKRYIFYKKKVTLMKHTWEVEGQNFTIFLLDLMHILEAVISTFITIYLFYSKKHWTIMTKKINRTALGLGYNLSISLLFFNDIPSFKLMWNRSQYFN